MILLLIACSSSPDSSTSHMLGVLSDTGDTGDVDGETGGGETGGEDTGEADTSLDTADTGSIDTADTADTADTVDTSPPPCTGLVFTPASATFEAHGGYAEYTTDSVTFDVTGCGSNVTAQSVCAGSAYGWFALSLPGDTDPAVFGGECKYGARESPLLDDSGALVDGEVTTTVTLVMVAFDNIDAAVWTRLAVNSDQGSISIQVDFN